MIFQEVMLQMTIRVMNKFDELMVTYYRLWFLVLVKLLYVLNHLEILNYT